MSLNKKIIHKILIVLISAIVLFSFFVPYSLVFNPSIDVGNEIWENSYITDDIILTTLYSIFSIFWLTYLLLNKNTLKIIVRLILILISILFFLSALANLLSISQDLIPRAGIFISIFILPLLICFLINSNRLNKSTLQ
jgi:hypothetical protein